jgi:putative YhdH/YhfP family quinone oxidoreductase
LPSGTPFRAIRVSAAGDRAVGSLVETTLDALDAGGVVIRTAFSGINYKDALAVTGSAPIIRRMPCIAGIEAVGTVAQSDDPRVTVGSNVIVHGFGLGVDHDGGFAQYVRVPSDWVMPLPEPLTPFEAATIGVAGYTAALAIHRMEHCGLAPGNGPVVVTGATGGVSSVGIALLAAAGYEVAAITSKPDAEPYLRALGAGIVLPASAIEAPGKPLRRGQWAGALDSVGGDTLVWLTSTMRDGAPIAAFGNAGGSSFAGSVLPFILRGVQLLGINSNSPMPLRRTIWSRIAGDLRPRGLASIGHTITLDDVPKVSARQIRGEIRGRSIIAFDQT